MTRSGRTRRGHGHPAWREGRAGGGPTPFQWLIGIAACIALCSAIAGCVAIIGTIALGLFQWLTNSH